MSSDLDKVPMARPFRICHRDPPRVAIAGGSIAGLGAGVALHRAGVEVNVYERDAGTLRSTGAGLVLQAELSTLLSVPDGPLLPTTSCSGRRHLGFDGTVGSMQRMPQEFTSWDAVHAALLMEFPAPRYHSGAAIEKVRQTDHGLILEVAGLGALEADVLIAADGAQSSIRRRLVPSVEADYAGYVAWRGTIPEREMPFEIIAAFDDVFTFGSARSGGHALAYFIPGDDLSTEQGSRRMN